MSFSNRYSGHGQWWWYTPMHKWLSFIPCNPGHLPESPGCYVLTLDGKAVYVGQSNNVQARFYSHGIKCLGDELWQTRWGILRGDLRLRVRFATLYGDWMMREARLLRRLRPSLNKRID